MKKLVIIIIVLLALGVAYYLLSPLWRKTTLNETIPTATGNIAKTVLRGELKPSAHDVKGSALIIETAQGRILRFENLDTVNGPDLRIYLSAGPDNKDFIDLGAIRATQGNINYEVPPGVDVNKYYALIWCRAFRILFSYAEMR